MASAAPVWFAIIDGARDPRLEGLVKGCKDHICLYKGKLDPQISQIAPWLVRLDEHEPLLSTWQQHGQGQNWGLMLLSALSLEDLQRHFRKFLEAQLPDGMTVMFRFYDPRVFGTYLASATPEELAPWFDGVIQYSVERADGQGLHQYRLDSGRLFDGDQPVG